MNGIAAYQQNAVTTTSKGRIVVLLYEGAIRFLRQAGEAIDAGDMSRKGQLINKAADILVELNTALDMQAGGEVAQNLRSLYNFLLSQLMRAHLKNDRALLERVVRVLENLLDGWRQIAE